MTLDAALKVAGPRGKVRLPGWFTITVAHLPSLELTAAARLSNLWEACPGPTEPGPWTPAETAPPETGPYLVCCREREGGFRQIVTARWHDRFGWSMAANYGDVTHWTPLPPMPDATPEPERKEEP